MRVTPRELDNGIIPACAGSTKDLIGFAIAS